jgi:hypothetical protein
MRRRNRRAAHDPVPGSDVTTLLQEAFEEDAPERKLGRIVTALGLLLASLNSAPAK